MLLEGVRGVLGEDLVGAYLHGSAVLGGFRPDSDIDVIVVSARKTTLEEKRRLIALLLSISGRSAAPRSGRPIELDIVVESGVRPWRYPPGPFDFHYNSWGGIDSRRESTEPWTSGTNPGSRVGHWPSCCSAARTCGPGAEAGLRPVPRSDYVGADHSETSRPSTSSSRGTRGTSCSRLPRSGARSRPTRCTRKKRLPTGRCRESPKNTDRYSSSLAPPTEARSRTPGTTSASGPRVRRPCRVRDRASSHRIGP